MKKVLFLFAVMLLSCGQEKKPQKKKTSFGQANVLTTQEDQTPSSSTLVDLTNPGIGPVNDLIFSNINDEMVQFGKQLYDQKCTACHKFDKRYIGPALDGIYERRSPSWVMNIMLNPMEMIKKDPIAKQLLEEYNNVVMYDQNLSYDEARAIAEYLR
ncbi:MAG: c-type cytochrome [Flavobacteriaceae bacterium]|tara:strand:- start:297 stop:767 length:471 start_codon:yes stop_codon:yes gene_type:complete